MIMGTFYIVIASILWGLVHSFSASQVFKRFVRKLFGSEAFYRLYRLGYNLFSLASFLPLFLMLVIFPDRLLYSIPAPWVYVSTTIQGMAVFVLIAGVMQTGPLEFAGISQLTPMYDDLKPTRLVIDGLYARVRHPLYSAGLVFIWFSQDMTLNRLVLWVVFTFYIVIGAFFEERKLLNEFGAEYAEYKARTPMLIPSWPKNKKIL